MTIDQDILAAIESIRNGNEVSLAAELIDKSLQRVFAIGIYDRVTFVADNFDNLTTDELALEWDRAHSAFVAVTGTAAKENKVLTADKQTFETGSNPNLDDQITLAFVNGRQALNKANADDRVNIALARENVIIPLVRSFLIGGVLGEVGELITNRDGDVDEARKEQVEAELFYRSVDIFIAQDNPTGSNRIQAQLSCDLSFQAMVTAMRSVSGDEKTAEWLTGIQANNPVVYDGNTPIVSGVAAGEVDVGFVNHYYLYRFLAEEGESFPARNQFLTSGGPGSLIMVSGAGILNTAPNAANAQRFMDFMLSTPAQQYFAAQTYEYPVVEGVAVSGGIPPFADLDSIALNISLADLDDLEVTQVMLFDLGIIE